MLLRNLAAYEVILRSVDRLSHPNCALDVSVVQYALCLHESYGLALKMFIFKDILLRNISSCTRALAVLQNFENKRLSDTEMSYVKDKQLR